MESVLSAFFSIVERGPLGFWAFLAGTFVAWGVMLRIRTWESDLLSVEARQFLGHVLGFVAGVAITYAVWPTRYGAITGLAVGMWGPWSWEAFLLVLEWKFPRMAARLRAPA